MMKLNTYLSERGISYSAFAAEIGRAVSTVSRLARDETRPDWATMRRIVAATDGAVGPEDFLNLEPLEPEDAA